MVDNRVMIFIDGENLFYAIRDYNKDKDASVKIDYVKLVKVLAGDRYLKRAYFFGSIPPNPTSKQINFHHRLQYEGIKTHIIPLKIRHFDFECPNCRIVTSFDTPREKGVDIALASEMLSLGLQKNYDTSILVSGDYDFHMALEVLQRNGVLAEVASFRNYNTNEEMIRTADRFIDLEDIIDQIKM